MAMNGRSIESVYTVTRRKPQFYVLVNNVLTYVTEDELNALIRSSTTTLTIVDKDTYIPIDNTEVLKPDNAPKMMRRLDIKNNSVRKNLA